MRMRCNSNRPISDCRPTVPVAGTCIGLPINSPLHLQAASAAAGQRRALSRIGRPFGRAAGRPSFTVSLAVSVRNSNLR